MEKIQEELRRRVVVVMVMVQIMLACDGEAQWRVPALVADPTQREQLCASCLTSQTSPCMSEDPCNVQEKAWLTSAQKMLLFLIIQGAFFVSFTHILQPETTQAVTSY